MTGQSLITTSGFITRSGSPLSCHAKIVSRSARRKTDLAQRTPRSRRRKSKNRSIEEPKGTGRDSRNVPWTRRPQERLADPARRLAGTRAAGRRPSACLRPAFERDPDPKTQTPSNQVVLVFWDQGLVQPRGARSCSPQRSRSFFESSLLRIFDVAVSACRVSAAVGPMNGSVDQRFHNLLASATHPSREIACALA